jgi:hypothetical protein
MSTEIPEPSSLSPDADPAGLPAPAGRRRFAVAGDLRAFLATALGSLILCIPVGALWAALAPSVQGTLSQGGVYYTSPEGKTFIGQDTTLGIICAVLGLALGTLAFFLFRGKGSVGAALGLAVGGLAGGYLATKAGTLFGPGHGDSLQKMIVGMADNTVFALPMQLRAVGMLWFWPLAAIFMYYILTLIFGPIDPDLQPPQQPAAWAYPVQQEQQAQQDQHGATAFAHSNGQAIPAGSNGHLNPAGPNGQIDQTPAEPAGPAAPIEPAEPVTASPVLPDEVDRGK